MRTVIALLICNLGCFATAKAQATLVPYPTATFMSDEPLVMRFGPTAQNLPASVPLFRTRLRFEASDSQWAHLDLDDLPPGSVFDVHYDHRDEEREVGVWLIVASSALQIGGSIVRGLTSGSLSSDSNAWGQALGVGLSLTGIVGLIFGIYYACLSDRVTATTHTL